MKGESRNEHLMGSWYTIVSKLALTRTFIGQVSTGYISNLPATLVDVKNLPFLDYDNPPDTPHAIIGTTREWLPKHFAVPHIAMFIGYRYIKSGYIYEMAYHAKHIGHDEVKIESDSDNNFDIDKIHNEVGTSRPRLYVTRQIKACLMILNKRDNPIYVLPEDITEINEAVDNG